MAVAFQQPQDAAAQDAYELRGGMSAGLSWQLDAPPAQGQQLASVCVDGQDLDFYEARGGLAEKLFATGGADAGVDEYEARGGLAEPFNPRLTSLARQAGEAALAAEEGIDYEARGGMAALASPKPDGAAQAKDIGFMLERQTSEASTCLPLEDSFIRAITRQQTNDAVEPDVYEARGGMAARQLLEAPEARLPKEAALLDRDCGELDPYEARGGLAGRLGSIAEECSLDCYEARGGMAAKLTWLLPQQVAFVPCFGDHEPDVYEMRGAMALQAMSAPVREESRKLDAYEVRGGMAATLAWQLPRALDQSHLTSAVSVDGQDLDFYEMRGGLAQKIFASAGEGAEVDEYEVRGGLAEQFCTRLPTTCQQPVAVAAPDFEGDEYELRGSMAEKVFAAAPPMVSVQA